MEKQLKVLMVVFNLSVANGVSSFVMNYFRKLDHNKITMDFVVYQDVETPYKEEILQAGGKIYVIPSIKIIKQHIKESKKIILDGQYDIVHDNILILSYFIMYFAKKYNVPVRILHSHSFKLSGSKIKALRNLLFMPLLLKEINQYIACSQAAAIGMFKREDIDILPNVVASSRLSFNFIKRDQIRENYCNPSNISFVIGSVGRLALEKNPLYAISTILEVAKTIKGIQYWWIGDGPLRPAVENYLKKHDKQHVVQLFGNRTDVADLYQAMDLFFLPSQFEGLPVTALEAQASGLPCLVSDTVSDEFVYTDLVTFFSLNDDISKITNIIRFLLTKKYDRSVYGQKLQESRFSDSNAGANLLQIYRDMIEKENHN